jgi:uncharacterized membrane protein
MTPPPVAPHQTLFRQVYAWLWAHTFKTWPSPVTEIVGGIGLLVIVTATVTFGATHQLLVIFLGTMALNILYALRWDPNDAGQKSELPDFALREAVLIAGVLLLRLFGLS